MRRNGEAIRWRDNEAAQQHNKRPDNVLGPRVPSESSILPSVMMFACRGAPRDDMTVMNEHR
jgi:hypothetical protein